MDRQDIEFNNIQNDFMTLGVDKSIQSTIVPDLPKNSMKPTMKKVDDHKKKICVSKSPIRKER